MEAIEPLGPIGLSPERLSTCFCTESSVAEIQGLYGPVSIAESVLQKIWLRQQFLKDDLKTKEGAVLKIISPGQWNLLEGPDFKEAILELDGRRVVGDVEVHFYAKDWNHHGHDTDPNYNNVVLHVLLFGESGHEEAVRTQSGRVPWRLNLLEYLYQDIEEYASEEVLFALARPEECALLEHLQMMPVEGRIDYLREKARCRWRQKCDYARQRLDRFGWEEACHQYVLEVMGYRRNRAPMSSIALSYPLESMREQVLSADALFEMHRGRWKLAGLRPANYPRLRLSQYLSWVSQSGQWPKMLRDWLGVELRGVASTEERSAAAFRRVHGLSNMRDTLKRRVVLNTLSGTRLDTLMIDAFLPLFAVFSGEPLFDYWYHWYVGDMPSGLTQFLRQSEVMGRSNVACNGLYQGGLQCFYERG